MANDRTGDDRVRSGLRDHAARARAAAEGYSLDQVDPSDAHYVAAEADGRHGGRSRNWLVAAALVMAVVIAAAVLLSATKRTTQTVAGSPDAETVSCNGMRLPRAAVAAPAKPATADMLNALGQAFQLPSGVDDWRVADSSDQSVTLIAGSAPTLTYAVLKKNGTSFSGEQLNSCLVRAVIDGREVPEFTIVAGKMAPDSMKPESTSLQLSLPLLPCDSDGSREVRVDKRETADAVYLLVTALPLKGEGKMGVCKDSRPTVNLDSPLGSRTVFDEGAVPVSPAQTSSTP